LGPYSTLSSTVSQGKEVYCWKTIPRSLEVPCTSAPSMRTAPLVGGCSPATVFRIDDFPQPEGPRKTTISPFPGLSAIASDTSRTASITDPERPR
jgi:hypothetical protein